MYVVCEVTWGRYMVSYLPIYSAVYTEVTCSPIHKCLYSITCEEQDHEDTWTPILPQLPCVR
ncbi:hypothetical protein GDO81_013539 [Engystomops pustulosus]|nr:hypothetical protein GDO81_013539 [Engystomops pustulosus]